jgi:glucose-6-phosphate isomerase
MAARWPSDAAAPVGMEAAVAFCQQQHAKLACLAEKLHNGEWLGVTGEAITDVVHIGVGGSDLGPKLVSEVLGDTLGKRFIRAHYVSTMDGSQLLPLMQTLNPATTLIELASKSFSTADTQFNARTALSWVRDALGVDTETLCRHQMLGVSAKPEKMSAFGIPEEHQLAFPKSIGGRFSVWSAIGVTIALELGADVFNQVLAGAHALDKHFLQTSLPQNIPFLLGAVGVWNTQFLDIPSHLVLPYDGRLKSLPPYLQQLEMESNGKTTKVNGRSVTHVSCPIVWGDVGPNAQHAFYQLVHQGSHTVSADFIAVARRNRHQVPEVALVMADQENLTLANCLAQSQLFALGDAAITDSLRDSTPLGYRGNQPNTVILLETLDAWSLGALLAMYEHKVFVQSVLWGINPFDQPGVELGKKLATSLYYVLSDPQPGTAESEHEIVNDAGTRQLLEQLRQWRGEDTQN